MAKPKKEEKNSGKFDLKLVTVEKIVIARGELGQVLIKLAGEDRFKDKYTSDTERFIGAAISSLMLANLCIEAAAESDTPSYSEREALAQGTAGGKLSAEIVQHLSIIIQDLPRIAYPRSSVSDQVREKLNPFLASLREEKVG